MKSDLKNHWNTVYGNKSEAELSWHQEDAGVSLEMFDAAGIATGGSAIDIGGGRSRLAGALLRRGVRDVTVLDLSEVALNASRAQAVPEGDAVTWVTADITTWEPRRQYDLWHDRAVFHFLVTQADRAGYLDRLTRAIAMDGHAMIATFAPDGPETCSGLPVQRYSPDELSAVLGGGFTRIADRAEVHVTPWGSAQSFQFCLFRKISEPKQ